MSGTAMARGDVVLTRFPFTDLTSSSLRPAVVVSTGAIAMDVVLIAISSMLRGGRVASDFTVEKRHPEFRATGLRVTSALRVHKLATVERTVIVRRLGTLSPALMSEVDKRLREVLALPA